MKHSVTVIPNLDILYRNLKQEVAAGSDIDSPPEDPYYLVKPKHLFILRDRFLLPKVQISGVIMFMLIKNRFIFGIDDSTGVTNCIYWPDRKDRDAQSLEYFFKTSMKVGSQVSVVGQLEYYNGEIQINVHKVCLLEEKNHDVFNELGQTYDA